MNNPVRSEWFTVVNPNAGNGKGKKDWERISDLFEKSEIHVSARFTEKKGQAIEFTRNAISDGFRKRSDLFDRTPMRRAETPLKNILP